MIKDTPIFSNCSEQYHIPRRKFNETNDCVVVSFAEAFNTSYDLAHSFMRLRVRRKNRGGLTLSQVKTIPFVVKNTKVIEGPYTPCNSITLNQFCKIHNAGRFMVFVKGHALSVIDGVIRDTRESKRRKVIYALRVYINK